MTISYSENKYVPNQLAEKANPLTSALIRRFVSSCRERNILYCHWKSNFALTQKMNGEIELDILIDRKSLSEIMTILLDIGFKLAVVKRGPETPSVFHYYAFDSQIGQFIHIHLFCSIFTGESFVKSHVLPLENMLLRKTTYLGDLKTTSKSAELAIFVLRYFIKYGSILDILYLFQKDEEIKSEISWLLKNNTREESFNVLQKYCPMIDENLFNKCIDALSDGYCLANKILLAFRVRWRLRIYKKNTLIYHNFVYAHLLLVQLARRLRRKKNKKLYAGGAVIAFVGPEATGKSTLVSEIEGWLAQVFAVSKVHAGKPVSTWLTWPLNAFLPLIRSCLPHLRAKHIEGYKTATHGQRSQSKIDGKYSLIYAIRAVLLAWDRRRLLVKTRRRAVNGEIVICDRYPSVELGAMDSPRLQATPSKSGYVTPLFNGLVRLEKALYDQIPPPDVVFRLTVSIEIAKKRNHERIKSGKETGEYVESRHRQSREWRKAGTKYIYDINTDQPLEETVLRVKRTIWESI